MGDGTFFGLDSMWLGFEKTQASWDVELHEREHAISEKDHVAQVIHFDQDREKREELLREEEGGHQ